MSAIEHNTTWEAYSVGWSSNYDNNSMYLAVSSFTEEYNNKLRLLSFNSRELTFVAEEEHPYPITKLQWGYQNKGSAASNQILATGGDHLRLWSVPNAIDSSVPALKKVSTLTGNNNNKDSSQAPITSLDWNRFNTNLIATSSIDTTCTIFDVEKNAIKTQLIAHDREVFDVAFKDADVFGSVGADGSVRLFDMRNLENSTIVYETSEGSPLVRLCWNKQDPNYLATFQVNSTKVLILDIRCPSTPLVELQGHKAAINCATFAPHSSCHIITGGEDNQALVYDLTQMKKNSEAILMYVSDHEVNSVSWSKDLTEWIAITSRNKVKALKI